jgi:signal transduction histidine kinase
MSDTPLRTVPGRTSGPAHPELRRALRLSPLFSDLPERELDRLLRKGSRVFLPSGTVLLEEGTAGDQFYVILEGELEVTRTEGGHTTVLDLQGAGGFLSEMSLLEDRPRSASARAIRDSEVLALDPKDFLDLLRRCPGVALAMLKIVMARLRSTETSVIETGRMAGLGTLAAGLAHELNNPAAAIARNTDLLAQALEEWHLREAELRRLPLEESERTIVADLLDAVRSAERDRRPTPSSGDREIELERWMTDKGVTDPWALVPVLSEAGWDPEGLEALEQALAPAHLEPVLWWLVAGLEAFALVTGIQTASRAISDIVNRVRSYSSLDRGPTQTVDVGKSLVDTLSILKGSIGPGIEVRLDLQDDLPTIEAHGGELGQVWTNLIHNALDAMEGEGTLEIRVRTSREGVVCEISDTGSGIPESIRPRIFDPFFTTKPQGRGTGLGLAITYGIVVNQHRGTIRVDSRPGRTVFEVALPGRLPEGPGS